MKALTRGANCTDLGKILAVRRSHAERGYFEGKEVSGRSVRRYDVATPCIRGGDLAGNFRAP